MSIEYVVILFAISHILFSKNVFYSPIYGINDKIVIEIYGKSDKISSLKYGKNRAHGFALYYYDNKQHGEVDFLVDDFSALSVVPLEIKSGKDYYVHSALNHFVSNEEYGIRKGIVFSNSGEVSKKGKIVYMPIYYLMYMSPNKE